MKIIKTANYKKAQQTERKTRMEQIEEWIQNINNPILKKLFTYSKNNPQSYRVELYYMYLASNGDSNAESYLSYIAKHALPNAYVESFVRQNGYPPDFAGYWVSQKMKYPQEKEKWKDAIEKFIQRYIDTTGNIPDFVRDK